MNNCKFTLLIESEDIYNKLLPEQKEQFDSVIITNVDLLNEKFLKIECLALGSTIKEFPYVQKVLKNPYITLGEKDK